MKQEEVLKWLAEEMTHENKTEILLAVVQGWDKLCPEDELVFVSLPRHDPTSRWETLHHLQEALWRGDGQGDPSEDDCYEEDSEDFWEDDPEEFWEEDPEE